MTEPPIEKRPKSPKYRPPGRPAVEEGAVRAAAEQLLAAGERPTVDAVRRICGGSPNKIAPLLTRWWKGLAERHRTGSPTAFDRLPGQLGLIAEAFFQEAIAQADRRVRAEHSREVEAVSQSQMTADVRSHVLSLREKEWSERLTASDLRVEELEHQLKEQRTLYRKTIASKDASERRVQQLLEEIARITVRAVKRPARAGKKQVTTRLARRVRPAPTGAKRARQRKAERRVPAKKFPRTGRVRALGKKSRKALKRGS